ncbi:M48 family metalloprotease [Streptomyces phaeofaciens]|uniref:M48 family metalloprotease n=1 Tax=Streptomyces phaeofaciens TaxID=68254 RepID=UPI00369CB5A9
MDTPRSDDHRAREWLLGTTLLAVAWLPTAVVGTVLLVVCLRWGPAWAALAPVVLVAGRLSQVLGGHGPLPGRAVRPDDEPELAALVQDIAGRLGFDQPLLVRIVPGVQASLGRTRISGVRAHVLLLGLPLLRRLTEAQLASVIAHELAHERHVGDRRATLLRFARAQAADRLDSRFRPTAPLSGPLLRASQPLLWRAETAADADAVRIAGTEATTEALHRTVLLHAVFEGLGEAWLAALAEEDSYPEDFYAALDAALDDPHVARRAARSFAEEDALDPYAAADHPPLDLRLAALPEHTGTPFGTTPVPLRTAAGIERWCRRALTHGDEEFDDGELRPVRLLELTPHQLRELGDDTGSVLLHRATGRDTPAEAVSAALDAVADGTWTALARRLEPSLRWAPASLRTPLARTVLTSAVARTLAGALRTAGWTPAGRWIDTVLTAPDGDRVVDVHEMAGTAVDTGDPGPLRALLTSTGPKEAAV